MILKPTHSCCFNHWCCISPLPGLVKVNHHSINIIQKQTTKLIIKCYGIYTLTWWVMLHEFLPCYGMFYIRYIINIGLMDHTYINWQLYITHCIVTTMFYFQYFKTLFCKSHVNFGAVLFACSSFCMATYICTLEQAQEFVCATLMYTLLCVCCHTTKYCDCRSWNFRGKYIYVLFVICCRVLLHALSCCMKYMCYK